MIIKPTGESSYKFGPCEVCGTHASSTFMLTDSVNFYMFGHEICLMDELAIEKRKNSNSLFGGDT